MRRFVIKVADRKIARWLSITLALIYISVYFALPNQSSLADTTDVYKKVQPSLGLVLVYKDSKLVATGSAFCVSSSSDRSLFLTNRHVVADGNRYLILVQSIGPQPLPATLVREGTGELDLAVLRVEQGNLTTDRLDSGIPAVGTKVAVAGYPLTQLALAAQNLGLTPSLHEGTVNALPGGGFYIQFDAQLEPGNSGGPVFDADTGVVYGVATLKFLPNISKESNAAISISAATTFLSNAHIAYAQGVPATLAGAASGNVKCIAALKRFASAYQVWDAGYTTTFTTLDSLQPLTQRFSSASYRDGRGIAGDMAAILDSAVTQLQETSDKTSPLFDAAVEDLSHASAPQTLAIVTRLREAMGQRDQDELAYLKSYRDSNIHYNTTGRAGTIDSTSITAANQDVNDATAAANDLSQLPPCAK